MNGRRTLVVTKNFPPRQGGIGTSVRAMTDRFPWHRAWTRRPSPYGRERATA